jgi:hypothetical protein
MSNPSPRSIRILNGALDEVGDEIILRGVIDPESLHLLQTADYQRGVLSADKINGLVAAYKLDKGEVPDVDLGMRGQRYLDRENIYYLQDDVFIVDGLQRVTAALHMLRSGGEKKPHVGALIHFSTTEEWERERFKVLNAMRTRVSVNILLRNLRHNYEVLETLYNLSSDKSFALSDRIGWGQFQRRGDLITAMVFLKTVGALHAHLGAGRNSQPEQLAGGLQRIMVKTGKNILRENIRTFFDLIDQCWGIRSVQMREMTPWIKGTFLDALATVLSRHEVFWRENRLFIEKPLLYKIKALPVQDPNIRTLASSGGLSRDMLINIMVDHINSGKRTKKLVPRVEPEEVLTQEEAQEPVEAE